MPNRLVQILRTTVLRWSNNDGNLLAASMAYYAAFSFFPLVLVLISALGFVLQLSEDARGARAELLDLIGQSMSPTLAQEVDRILVGVEAQAPVGGPLGLVTLLIGAIAIFSQLETAFDRLWQAHTPKQRGIRIAIREALWNRLKAFLTLLALGLIILLGFVANVILASLQTWAQELPGGNQMWNWFHLGFSVVLNAAALSLVYRMIPRVPVEGKHAMLGGLVVAVIWQLGSQLLSRVVVMGHYTAYGVVGSFIAMMFWVYCASILLFLGGQLVQVLDHPEE